MYKREITYTDWNGVERTETFYFHFTKSELTEFEASMPGGMSARMSEISAAKDMPEMMKFFKSIIIKSYAEKSADGRRLMKGENNELAKAFVETPAYDILFQDIFLGDKMVEFLTGIMPDDIGEKMRPQMEEVLKNAKAQLPAGA